MTEPNLTDDLETEASAKLWELINSGSYTKKQLLTFMSDQGYAESLIEFILHSWTDVHWKTKPIKRYDYFITIWEIIT